MSDPIDTKIVSRLAAILKMNDLAELEYETETCRISLIKSHAPLPPAPAPFTPAPAPVPAAPAVAAETPAVAAPAADNAADLSKLPGCVKSPMVGVVYLSSDPNTPNYVKIGDTVAQGDTVCLIEAMKTFNPVKPTPPAKLPRFWLKAAIRSNTANL